LPAEERRGLGVGVDGAALNGLGRGADEPVRGDGALALHDHGAALLHQVQPLAHFGYRVAALGADVDAQRLAVALHSAGRVDRVTEQAVARHRQTHHAGNYRT
jgi:hypothetical protein